MMQSYIYTTVELTQEKTSEDTVTHWVTVYEPSSEKKIWCKFEMPESLNQVLSILPNVLASELDLEVYSVLNFSGTLIFFVRSEKITILDSRNPRHNYINAATLIK